MDEKSEANSQSSKTQRPVRDESNISSGDEHGEDYLKHRKPFCIFWLKKLTRRKIGRFVDYSQRSRRN